MRKAPSALYGGTDDLVRYPLTRDAWWYRVAVRWRRFCRMRSPGLPIGLVAAGSAAGSAASFGRATDALLAVPFLILAIAPSASRPVADHRDDR